MHRAHEKSHAAACVAWEPPGTVSFPASSTGQSDSASSASSLSMAATMSFGLSFGTKKMNMIGLSLNSTCRVAWRHHIALTRGSMDPFMASEERGAKQLPEESEQQEPREQPDEQGLDRGHLRRFDVEAGVASVRDVAVAAVVDHAGAGGRVVSLEIVVGDVRCEATHALQEVYRSDQDEKRRVEDLSQVLPPPLDVGGDRGQALGERPLRPWPGHNARWGPRRRRAAGLELGVVAIHLDLVHRVVTHHHCLLRTTGRWIELSARLHSCCDGPPRPCRCCTCQSGRALQWSGESHSSAHQMLQFYYNLLK